MVQLLCKAEKKVKTQNYDLAIRRLDRYPKELKAGTQANVRIHTFIATLLTRARRWDQPQCPSMDEWISKQGHIHTMNYAAIKGMKYCYMGREPPKHHGK